MSGSSTSPRLLGPYCLLMPLAEGGMGAVHIASALDEPGDRLCLIKTLKPGADQGSDEYLRRFLDEARVALRLQGEHLCHVFDAGEVDGVRFLAMELIEGVTFRRLTDLLSSSSEAVPEIHAVTLGLGLLRGLHAAHAAYDDNDRPLGVVHRDVSPQNVMVDRFGQVKVIDFGLATSTLKETVTEQAVVMGKMAYMAPEQARGEPVSAAADQYAAAVVLYELLTGDRYYGDLPSRGIWGIVGAGTHKPRSWDRLSSSLAPILARALAASPADRFPDCAAFADALVAATPATNDSARRIALRDWIAPRLTDDLRPVEEARALLRATSPSLRHNAVEATQRVRVRLQGVKSSVSTSELLRPVMVPRAALSSGQSSASLPLSPHEATEGMMSAPAALAPPPPRGRVPLFIAAGLVGLVVVALVGVGRRDRGPVAPPLVPVAIAEVPAPLTPPAPPPVTAPPVVAPPVVPSPELTPPPVVAPPPSPQPASSPLPRSSAIRELEVRVAKLSSCTLPCAKQARQLIGAERIKDHAAAGRLLSLCEKRCAP